VSPAADNPPLAGSTLWIAAVALALGTFMQVLDSTIANVSLTTIAGNLGVSADNSTWVITAFAVANGVTVPLTGWLMGRFGVVKTFVVSVTLFTIASFTCGIAWSLPSLVVFRLIQGGVSGPMIPGSQALLISIFPEAKRGTALGLWSMTALVGPVAGPILGGYISDNYHWGWIFLINVPVGVLCAGASWFFLRHRETPSRPLPIDKVGLFLLAFWVGSLQVVLDLGKNADWFNSTMIVALTICAVIGFVAWIIWELTDGHPAVDLSLFRNRNFALGTAAFCLGYALFFANNLLLPLWLQQQLGYTATWAGLVSAPSGLVAVICTPLLTRLNGKIDMRWLATFSLIMFGISYLMRSGYTPDTDFLHFTLPLLVQGVAMSVFFLSMVSLSLDGIAAGRVPSATGISNFARITGAALPPR
jgi:DHA2 family multidrug resistance protein